MNQFGNQMVAPQLGGPMMTQNPYLVQRQNPYFQQAPSNGITWVQGIEGAKAWQLSPNSNVLLMDSENDGRFYIKVSDNVGMCNLRVFTYKEVTNVTTQAQPDLSEYVKKSELQSMLKEMLGGSANEPTIPTDDGEQTTSRQRPTVKKHDEHV